MVDPPVPERLRWAVQLLDVSPEGWRRVFAVNVDHVASGRAVFHHLDLAEVDLVRRALTGQHFDKALAVNINLFWVRPASAELQLIEDLLGPNGVLHLVYEAPGEEQASRAAKAVTAALADRGFATAVTTASSPSLMCITGRPTHDA